MNDIVIASGAAIADIFAVISKNISIDLAFKIAIIYGLIIWLAAIIWVIKDITNRSTNILLHVLAVLIVIVLTPVFGLPIYFLIRPSTTLFERYYEETSLEALSEEDADESGNLETSSSDGISWIYRNLSCPHCLKWVDANHHYCPHCGKELMVKCIHCKTSMNGSWKFCPECGKNQIITKKTKKKGEGETENLSSSIPSNEEVIQDS